jgi:biopolymer transport protein ExbD
MNFRRVHARDEPEINFIPLIDVLLVILIFVLVTTTYSRISELQITLPEADAQQQKQRPAELNVGIDASGRYAINKQVFKFSTVAALAEALRQAAQGSNDPIVVISADANTTHQSVVHVMEAARLDGYTHITFATQTPQ